MIENLTQIDEIKVSAKERNIIYFLMNEESITYIGQSSCGLRRAFTHQFGNKEEPEKPFTSIKVYAAPEDRLERSELERQLINFYKPTYNRKKKNV